jgi:hypothetical protein
MLVFNAADCLALVSRATLAWAGIAVVSLIGVLSLMIGLLRSAKASSRMTEERIRPEDPDFSTRR